MISISSHLNRPTITILAKFPHLKGRSSNFLPLNSSMASIKHSVSFSSSSKDRSLPAPRAAGEIHVIVGPMFFGKTTALLRRIKSEGEIGRNVAMIKSSNDTRYAIDSVVTHDGIKFSCWALPDLSSFRENFGDDAYEKITSEGRRITKLDQILLNGNNIAILVPGGSPDQE